ncbi:hypothetical protein GRI58_06750 [Porphyrobacter algicida]|uniref:Pilus assembly protein n=1 Tax=Qipengyuania algicida TaxID=1836209 RepID=A0A845AGH8_9SPHN|nr:hypothetical protein [Qipengyuania algicida]
MRGSLLRRLWREKSGVALLEFAYTLPIIVGIGAYGIELSNYAIINLRISQVALSLADNASRVGTTSNLTSQQLREVDINDIFKGVQLQGNSINLTKFGRVTLSSLENVSQTYDSSPVQRIHWQRCIGLVSDSTYGSSYGTTLPTDGITSTATNKGTAVPAGMGEAGSKVNAPQDSGVMFVEINYQYQPLFGGMLISARKIHYTASFIVRDKRDFSQIYNPSPTANRATCDKYNA